jgi:pimeloyl-ACP methyl ester carboxylesterase
MTFSIPDPHHILDLEMADGAAIRVRRHGNPNGTRLYLCHGNGFAIDAYFPFWGRLLDRFDLIVFDARNHGWNPFHGKAHHDYAHIAADLGEIRSAADDAFGTKPAIGAFHSMSARAALKTVLDGICRWDALLLFDPPMIPTDPAHPLYRFCLDFEGVLSRWAMKRPVEFDAPEELAKIFASSNVMSRLVPGAADLLARSILRRSEDGKWRLACPPELEASIYEQNMPLSIWPRAEDLDIPVLFAGADPAEDEMSPPAKANRALHDENGLDYVCVAGTTHMMQMEKPEACEQVLLDFLARNDVSSLLVSG